MNKKALIELVLIELKRQHQTLFNSALEAKSAATDEESKAENKYDTRGLEASYLAGAQAKRTTELEETIKVISDFLKTDLKPHNIIQSTSLVSCEIDGEKTFYFLILPKVGGLELNFEARKITVLSPESPLGEHLTGLKTGDYFEFHIKGQVREYEILSVE